MSIYKFIFLQNLISRKNDKKLKEIYRDIIEKY